MNIYLSFLQSPYKYEIPAYDFWIYYVENALKDTKYNLIYDNTIDWAKGLTPLTTKELEKWKDESWGKLIGDIKRKLNSGTKIDLFLSYLYPEQIDINGIKELKRIGIPCVNFFCDNVRLFRRVPDEYKYFDLNWVPEIRAIPMYKREGLNSLHLPMPMWVSPDIISRPIEETSKPIFIGSKDILRSLLLYEVTKNEDIDIEICGTGWSNFENKNQTFMSRDNLIKKLSNQYIFIKKFGLNAFFNKFKQVFRKEWEPQPDYFLKYLRERPSFEEYCTLTRNSLVCIGINRVPSYNFSPTKPLVYSRLRDIEAPMLGACYLTEWTEDLECFYNLDRDIEVYRSGHEMALKIKDLARSSIKRDFLRKNAQERALNELNIQSSIEKISNYLKI